MIGHYGRRRCSRGSANTGVPCPTDVQYPESRGSRREPTQAAAVKKTAGLRLARRFTSRFLALTDSSTICSTYLVRATSKANPVLLVYLLPGF
jgi:hypothetical protein